MTVAHLFSVTLDKGIAPFPGPTEFTVDPVTDDGPLYMLRAVTPGGPEFVAIDPVAYFPYYHPEVPDTLVAELGLDVDNAAVLALVSIPATGAADATANLLAPLVVNKITGAAAQVVLHDEDAYPVKARLRR